MGHKQEHRRNWTRYTAHCIWLVNRDHVHFESLYPRRVWYKPVPFCDAHFSVHPAPADGSCLLHSLCQGLYLMGCRPHITMEQLRGALLHYAKENFSDLAAQMGRLQLQRTLCRLRRREWGESSEIRIFTEMAGCCVCVWDDTESAPEVAWQYFVPERTEKQPRYRH